MKPHKIFDKFILALIIISSIILAIDNPLYDPKSKFMIVLRYIDISFTCLFTVEMCIKIIGKGFCFNKMGPVIPYIKSSWNLLDCFVVFSSLFDLCLMIA